MSPVLWEAALARNLYLPGRGVLMKNAAATIEQDGLIFRMVVSDLDVPRSYAKTSRDLLEIAEAWEGLLLPISAAFVGRLTEWDAQRRRV
jgi:hypothetical protein